MFVPNPDFAEEMSKDEQARKGLAEAVEPARAAAEGLTKRIMPRQSEAIVVEVTEDGVFLVNTDHGAHLAEWGSRNNPPYAPLRRGITAAGLKFEETPKGA